MLHFRTDERWEASLQTNEHNAAKEIFTASTSTNRTKEKCYTVWSIQLFMFVNRIVWIDLVESCTAQDVGDTKKDAKTSVSWDGWDCVQLAKSLVRCVIRESAPTRQACSRVDVMLLVETFNKSEDNGVWWTDKRWETEIKCFCSND